MSPSYGPPRYSTQRLCRGSRPDIAYGSLGLISGSLLVRRQDGRKLMPLGLDVSQRRTRAFQGHRAVEDGVVEPVAPPCREAPPARISTLSQRVVSQFQRSASDHEHKVGHEPKSHLTDRQDHEPPHISLPLGLAPVVERQRRDEDAGPGQRHGNQEVHSGRVYARVSGR
jgi:hypothetical protein